MYVFILFIIGVAPSQLNLLQLSKRIVGVDHKAENTAPMWYVMSGTFSNSLTAIHGRTVGDEIRTTFVFVTEIDSVRRFLPNLRDDI